MKTFGPERNLYLGGSEAAAILGMSRWKTPMSVWAEKTGKVIRPDISDKLFIKLGNKLEQCVAELFEEETGKKVHKVNETLYHKTYKFLGANIDRRVVGEDAGLECKTASAYKLKEWKGGLVPREYFVQCQHYMAVTGRPKWYIAVLIDNQNFMWSEVKRDEKFIEDMVIKEVDFWLTYVVPKIMPPEVSYRDSDTISGVYPQAVAGNDVALGVETDALVAEIEACEKVAKNAENEIEQLKNEVKLLLKDAESGHSNHYFITWKNQSTARLDTAKIKKENPEMYSKYAKVTESRVFRYKKIEEE